MTDVTIDPGAVQPAAEQAPVVQPEAPAPQPSLRETLESVWDKHNPLRGKDGTFEARAQPEAPAEQAVETEKTETPDQPKEEAAPEPAKPAIDAPNSWSAEYKAKWGNLPSDIQEYVLKRENEAHQAITRLGQANSAFRPFAELVERYQGDFQRQNVTPVEGIGALLNIQSQMEVDPGSTIAWLAERYGVDLAQLAMSPAPQQQRDPEVLRLKQEIGELRSHMTASQRASQEAEMQAAARELEAFGKDKPYFAEPDVQPLMGALLQAGRAKDLSEAYEMAIHALPSIRQRIEADQRAKDEAKRKAEAEKAAKEAKKAAAVNVKGSNGAAPGAPKSFRESLEAAYDRIQAAG